MTETQAGSGAQAAAASQDGMDYNSVAAAAYRCAEASHEEGGSSGSNDFDLAYNFARKAIADAGHDVDSNALFMALTAEKQKRSSADQQQG